MGFELPYLALNAKKSIKTKIKEDFLASHSIGGAKE
jgi:hypothetical protein